MPLRLVQFLSAGGDRCVAAVSEGGEAWRIKGWTTVLALAQSAVAAKSTLKDLIDAADRAETVDLGAALQEGRLLAPVDHPDSARVFLTGTGLTHLGSADARDKMHAKAHSADASDSMKMFRMGLEGGKREAGQVGVQPEWFYKGDGRSIVGPEKPLPSPEFALDGGEEPELAGIYWIAADGTPYRLGFTLANEFSDHVMERMNYLYLAHSKLRHAALGPELLLGELPVDIRGYRAHHACGRDDMGKIIPHRRGEYVAPCPEPRTSSFQIRLVSQARRLARPLLWNRNTFLRRQSKSAGRRRVRD